MKPSHFSSLIDIVLYCPEIPHNTGAIGRLCVGLDIRLHLIHPLGFALTDRFLKRAGLDYWEFLDVTTHENWDVFVKATSQQRIWLSTTKTEHSLFDCHFTKGDIFLFGSESSGVPEHIHQYLKKNRFRIPMSGQHARSLNLAQAVAVATYEAYRQLK